MECPICKKDFDEYTGRRAKKFCSDACKIKFFNAKKKLDKIVNTPEQKEERKRVVEDLMEKGIAKTKVTGLTPEANKTNYTIDTDKIAELEKELQTIPDVGLGKSRRRFIEKQIYNLKK